MKKTKLKRDISNKKNKAVKKKVDVSNVALFYWGNDENYNSG